MRRWEESVAGGTFVLGFILVSFSFKENIENIENIDVVSFEL